MRANTVWLNNLSKVLSEGAEIDPRGLRTREIIAHTSVVDMTRPVVTHLGREMGFKFLAAEAHWILSGDNRVETIRPYANIAQFSDDGYRFQGAYGPKVSEQLRYVCETLSLDPGSRQAVLTVWRENPRQSRDIPCTISLQFIIRDNRINCIATMRSSDLWLGWVYDVFNFTMITTWVSLRLREMSDHLPTGHTFRIMELGNLYLTAGSQHLYSKNVMRAEDCLKQGNSAWSYEPLSLSLFNTPNDLMAHLVALRDHDWDNVKHLKELKSNIS